MSNQSPIHTGYNAFLNDGVLVQMTSHMPESLVNSFAAHGRWVGSREAMDLARMANDNPPKLRALDARGERVDLVEFHPAYHALMRRGVSIGLSSSIWSEDPVERGIRNEARAVRFMLTSQLECGHTCPLTMTHASIAALMTDLNYSAPFVPLFCLITFCPAQATIKLLEPSRDGCLI